VDDGCPPDQPNCGAPDGFRPDGFRPDGFTGDGFPDLPDGFLPDGFPDLPDGFLPDGFDPDGSTDGAIPDGGLPDGALPDGFPTDLGDGFVLPDGCTPQPERCNNDADDDCDGRIDCDDIDCLGVPVCALPPEDCTNKIDDDRNGRTDCADPACFGHPACVVPGVEICNNLLDDDDDGLIDCADPDCMNSPACKPNMGMEICDNGVDDNNDQLIDCADPQCVRFPGCLNVNCRPEVDFGALAPQGADVTRTLDTRNSPHGFATCAPPGGRARVGQFTLAAAADVRLDFSQPAGAAHVVSLHRAGVGQKCDQNLVSCLQVGQSPTGTRTYQALQPGTYYVIVQSFPNTPGATTVRLRTGNPQKPEICNNGVDDDGDGLKDCADLDCLTSPNCLDVQCEEDIRLGTLVIDGPARPAVVNTTTSSDRYHPTCAGTSTGKDVTVSFTLPATAGILVQWNQTGDHAFGLFVFPPPGLACDTTQSSCYYPGGRGGGSVAFAARPAGKYVFVFKAIRGGAEGILNINVSAFSNRRIEICSNNIDDDGDNLVDCDDPDCFGVSGCGVPICQPDVDLGDFSIGTSRTLSLDTLGGTNLYSTTCGQGTGKERVVRLNLTQPMALNYSCTQTGSHVLQLGAQLNPLDRCDANNFNCADPAVLPFGCNFSMPNLQPGRYNVIVEAFAQGQEGTVNLTLTGLRETVLEICDNGIDDDMDGATDCMDRKCVTSPLCRPFRCRSDEQLGLLALDGTPTSVVAPTANRGDDQKSTTCVTASGGQDAVVSFELPAKADLKIEWAQVGNHAFALYPDGGPLLACDAGTLVNCTASMGAATGAVNLTNVPKGRYHLVIDATQPGAEGGVVVQFSGNPSP
jgi:hypothetical protein